MQPPVKELCPVNPGRKLPGFFAFVLLALILLPVLHSLFLPAGSTARVFDPELISRIIHQPANV